MEGRPLIVHCAPVREARPVPASPGEVAAGEVQAWFSTLPDLRGHLDRYAAVLDDAEQARAARYRFDADRERYIIGHGLLRELLGHYLNIDPVAVRMLRGPHGKPYIEGHPLHFNLSDTKDALLIAFSVDQEIGADIETMTRKVDHEAVSAHYFTPEEIAGIQEAGAGAGANDLGKRRFLELWTRKEAVLKASGVGIMEDLRVLRVDTERNENWITHAEFVRMAAAEYHVISHRIGAEHLISLATPGRIERLSLFAVL